MKTVFVVQHSYELDCCEKTKFIGVYASDEEARGAVSRLRNQPGFRNHPDEFHVTEYEIGKDHWTEGFFTVPEERE